MFRSIGNSWIGLVNAQIGAREHRYRHTGRQDGVNVRLRATLDSR